MDLQSKFLEPNDFKSYHIYKLMQYKLFMSIF